MFAGAEATESVPTENEEVSAFEVDVDPSRRRGRQTRDTNDEKSAAVADDERPLPFSGRRGTSRLRERVLATENVVYLRR